MTEQTIELFWPRLTAVDSITPKRFKTSLRHLVQAGWVLILAGAWWPSWFSSAARAETVYDNTHLPHNLELFGPDPPDNLFAQPFNIGNNNAISSISLYFGGWHPSDAPPATGTIPISIWDDDGNGDPGHAVAAIGSVDVSTLANVFSNPQSCCTEVVFDSHVGGLTPMETYYVVGDWRHLVDNTFTYPNASSVLVPYLSRSQGTNGGGLLHLNQSDEEPLEWLTTFGFGNRYLQMSVTAEKLGDGTNLQLLAGDADQDLDFDQLDLVKVQIANKYLAGQAATWGEGDWDGAPGGSPGSPPAGDGLFNQIDIIAAQQAATYLAGPYAVVQAGGQRGDAQTSVVYDPSTGEVAVDAPSGVELTSINIDSATGIFTGDAAANLGGSFDNDADGNIFKATFGSSFGSVSFGNVAQAGLSEEFVLGDLSVVGSLAGGGDLGDVDLVYVPEPTSAFLIALGLVVGLLRFRRVDR